MISFGEEGNVYTSSSLVVSNDINDQKRSSNIAVKNTTSANATVSNDQVYRLSSSQILSGAGPVSSVSYLTVEPTLNLASAATQSNGTATSPSQNGGNGLSQRSSKRIKSFCIA